MRRKQLLTDIDRLADARAADIPADRDEIALRLRAHVAKLAMGDHVHTTLSMIAAIAIVALERHDALQAPAPAAAYRLRQMQEAGQQQ